MKKTADFLLHPPRQNRLERTRLNARARRFAIDGNTVSENFR